MELAKTTSKIIIGTRGSDLALAQADIVSHALKSADPKLQIEIRTITTHGDTDQRPIPADANGKGWFTKEIEEELLAGQIDIAVHSLKDVGEVQPADLTLAAYLSREDARDALITKNGESLEKLSKGAIVGTDSPRRQSQMLAMRGDFKMTSLRGNVLTRLAKLDGTFKEKLKKNASSPQSSAQKYDAIILAVAGLRRLSLQKRITRIFEPNEMTPAPGQGILTVQARKDDKGILNILEKINDADTAHIAEIERSFARAVGAGCKSPTGAYAFRDGNDCRLIAMIAEDDGSNMARGEARLPWAESKKLGEALAAELLKKQKQLSGN